jgi:integrative and conjugative element protein (TIGR02256 family)
MLKKIIFSDRAWIALLTETLEKITTETGGLFLGYRKGETWYIIETIDPGPKSIFQKSYFEYDLKYVNHLINKINKLYREPLDLIGLWHRHPGSFDSFSGTDDQTNTKYANLNKDGAISALVNIDPNFRLTIYSVTLPLRYDKVSYHVGDQYIPTSFMDYVPQKTLLHEINKEPASLNLARSIITKVKSYFSINNGNGTAPFDGEYINTDLILTPILHKYLLEDKNQHKIEQEFTGLLPVSDNNIERILASLQIDWDYFNDIGIEYNIALDSEIYLKLQEKSSQTVPAPILLRFFFMNDNVLFKYNNETFLYEPGMFKEACKSFHNGCDFNDEFS